MTIKIQNKDLAIIYAFLGKLSLKSKKSRARTRLSRLLEEKYREYAESTTELQKQFAICDEDGNLVEDGDGLKWETPSNKIKFLSEKKELDDEEAVINCTEIMQQMNVLHEVLEKLDMALEGDDAIAYDVLCEGLENLTSKEEEEK